MTSEQPNPYRQPGHEWQPASGPAGSGASAGLKAAGVFLGPLATILGLSIMFIGVNENYRSMSMLVGPDAGGVLLMVLGALVLALVALSAAWAPLAPIVGGALAALTGLLGSVSRDFLESLYELVPDIESSSILQSWIILGALFSVGAILIAAGCAATIVERRSRPAA